jgi:hypothetical protein
MKWYGWLIVALGVVAIVLLWPLRAPAQVTSITLDWTAPGDDGNVGTATSYEMRWSTTRPDTTGLAAAGPAGTPAVNSWWSSATVVGTMPAPLVAGTTQTKIVTGTFAPNTYYFLLKACDEVPNCSGYSNLAAKVILDAVPPARILDLIVR